MGIAIGTGNARLYIGDTEVTRAYLGATQIHGGGAPEPSTQYVALTDRIMFSGHSLVDAIFSGSGDPRQTLTALLPDGPKIWRKATIPGSTLHIRWGWRNGGDDQGGMIDPPPAPLDWDNPYDRGPIPALDLPDFDAVLITEGGPFALPLNPDRFNAQWNGSADYLDRWWSLATSSGIAPGKFVFWTIWPGTEFVKDAEDDAALPDFMAFLKRYGEVAEQWCARRNIRIIPGHRIWQELWSRLHDGRLPGVFDAIMADSIHPNFLGSIFTAVGAFRHLFGIMPETARIQALLDQETGHAFTVQHVLDVVTATLDYVQGPGVDLQAGTYVPPAAFLDCSQSPAGQGFTVIGSYTPGQPAGAGNGFRRALSTEPANMYAILDLDFTEAAVEGATAIAMATNPEWNSWDAKFLGLELNGSGANQNFSLRDGDRATNMVQPKPWSGSQRLLVEINAGPNGRRIRGLNDPGQWLPAWDARGTRALISTRFGVNVSWANGALLTTDGNFTIHRGLVYLDYPDALTRLRLIAHFCGGMVP